MKLRGNVYEGSLNTIFFTELNLTSSSIYESLCKKGRIQCHLIKLTQSLLNQLKWDILDLAPSDYYLILSLNCDLDRRHFAMKEDLQSVVVKFFG